MWKSILETYKCLTSCRRDMPGMPIEELFKQESGAVKAIEQEYEWLKQHAPKQDAGSSCLCEWGYPKGDPLGTPVIKKINIMCPWHTVRA